MFDIAYLLRIIHNNMDTLLLKQNTRDKLENFWTCVYTKAENDKLSTKEYNLPLARIKRLMKVEEQVKMVSCEVPTIFTKVTERFIEELTLRAWINTEECKRKVLNICDISAALKTSEMFDFLIYVVPQSENINMNDQQKRNMNISNRNR